MKPRLFRRLAVAALAAVALPAAAQSAGHYTTSYGIHGMVPASSNGTLTGSDQRFSADTAPALSFSYEYFFRGNLGLEIQTLVGQQKIGLEQGGDVGRAWALSPTFSLQYHFNGNGDISPFVGVGLNYTTFLGADGKGAFARDDVKFKDSFGPAVHAGVDFAVGERSALRVDARWTSMRSDVEVNSGKLGEAKLDPITYGVAYMMYF
ncbi:outer membrane beta-barrel protein [Xanthomonas sp. AM6]|uniref:OmpW/AlkL family protein n=1 Tax=Xanthomonas sp. AM6 TaxID=2982531 RepID=UPI0021D9A0A1|nr:OmpW family outer membrane protein [Xanthomonas sp. AM6]UYB53266.1 outer membrane beta-barrel protein [Xanthomonas sp. AM6]